MALPRSLSFLRMGTGPQILEAYVDPLCPFCAKICRSIDANVLPLMAKGGKHAAQLSIVIRLLPQPFFSAFHIEAALIVGAKYPELFWPYLIAQFDTQEQFWNQPVMDMTPSQCRDRLTDLAMGLLEKEGILGSGPKSQVYGQLREAMQNKGTPNGGNDATDALKYNVKLSRQNGVHVTPTVLFDGIKDDAVSSSWGKAEWEKFLGEKLSK